MSRVCAAVRARDIPHERVTDLVSERVKLLSAWWCLVCEVQLCPRHLFFAPGTVREVTVSRVPLRRPVCTIPKGTRSSHSLDVCLHPCVQLGDPESRSLRQAHLATPHELLGFGSSGSWCQASVKGLPCFGSGVVIWCVLLELFRKCHPESTGSLPGTASSFQRMLHVSPLPLHFSNSGQA